MLDHASEEVRAKVAGLRAKAAEHAARFAEVRQVAVDLAEKIERNHGGLRRRKVAGRDAAGPPVPPA